jgi:hypothetical protein
MSRRKPASVARKAERHASQEVSVHVSDITIAKLLARAICATPGVVDLSPGLFAIEATYGPGERLPGIVVRRPTPDALAIEVRVVLAENMLKEAFSAEPVSQADRTPLLLRFADQLRTVVAHTISKPAAPVLTAVDVAIDDIR